MPLQPKPFQATPRKFHPRGTVLVYEDHDLLVVDKRAGLLTVAYENQPSEVNAYQLLLHYVRRGNPKSRARIYMVHRLDRDTSGLLLFAKSPEARKFLIDSWHSFHKNYLAVVAGILPEKVGNIRSYLADGSKINGYKVASVLNPKLGQFASTDYKVIRENGQRSLLELTLNTGRKNQIRVHLSEMGFPILGDSKYGDKTPGIKRLALHAARMRIQHPYTQEPMSFEAPVPETFDLYMR